MVTKWSPRRTSASSGVVPGTSRPSTRPRPLEGGVGGGSPGGGQGLQGHDGAATPPGRGNRPQAGRFDAGPTVDENRRPSAQGGGGRSHEQHRHPGENPKSASAHRPSE